jgi:dihydroorotate dehydrogenase electron transfer subunit
LPLTPHPPYSLLLPVLSNREIAPEVFLLAFEEPRLVAAARPGQFVMLSIPWLEDPLLPRPFAVYGVEGSRLEILYRRVGKGTGLLAQVRSGDVLRVLGPLGNGFSLPEPSVQALVLAGGIGIASVHFLLARLVERGSAPTSLLYGARSPEEIIPLEHLENKGLLVRVATEDGGKGLKGVVTDLLPTALDPDDARSTIGTEAFVCGPLLMLKAVAGRLTPLEIETHCSLEARMACGYGVCQGCVIPFKDPSDPKGIHYRKVCTDGPVFAARDVCWEAIR